MLTKKEREAIAERVSSFNEDYLCYADIYECFFGERPRYSALSEEYDKAIKSRLIDLCDTSNMVELPLDKDGEVIHLDDVVYDEDGNEHRVGGYSQSKYNWEIIISFGSNGYFINGQPNKLTHKKPVTIASLVSELRHVLSQTTIINKEATSKLWEITDKIEMLGDSDD